MDTLEERFAAALHGTARSWRLAVDRRLKLSGVTQAGWMALAVAANSHQPLSQSELAERLGVEGATVVAMVDRLVKAGLAAREPSTADRRVKHVVISEAGRRLYDRVKLEAAAVRENLLSLIDRTRLAAALQVLEEVEARIVASGATAHGPG